MIIGSVWPPRTTAPLRERSPQELLSQIDEWRKAPADASLSRARCKAGAALAAGPLLAMGVHAALQISGDVPHRFSLHDPLVAFPVILLASAAATMAAARIVRGVMGVPRPLPFYAGLGVAGVLSLNSPTPLMCGLVVANAAVTAMTLRPTPKFQPQRLDAARDVVAEFARFEAQLERLK